MPLNMTLTIKHRTEYATQAQWDSPATAAPDIGRKQMLQIGDTVEYCGHTIGGMVLVRLDTGEKVVIHPAGTVELSQKEGTTP